ncbi:MAG: hypothetical protein M0R46_17230 [Candidatus Muirbacterium halophilum]|nr:hypothetical protein [Candidatus Muirbacterium halophilum]
MKYLKKFNENINRSEIDAICGKYNITNYTINDDGSIDVDGNVDLSHEKLKVLPLKFRKVSGNFECSFNKLTSLKGSPQTVGGYFYCRDNQLTSLEGAPQSISGYFDCNSNQLTTLEGAPQRIGGNFNCSSNQLTSLEGVPQRVGKIFSCINNNLKNIDYLPKYYKELFIGDNPIYKIINLFTTSNEYGMIYDNRENKDLIMDFIDAEIIQQDKLLVNRLVEFLDDIGKPKSREELIELLKNNYTIR